MEDWIAGTFAVLGTLMVLAGAALIVLKTLGRLNSLPDADTQPLDGALGGGIAGPAPEPGGVAGRRLFRRRLSLPSQLIGWGILLLVLAALTVGLISFGVSLDAGTQ